MVNPEIYTATRNTYSVGQDNLATLFEAACCGREALINTYPSPYPGYAYTDALASKILHNGNPIKAMQDLHKDGFYNYRNLGEAVVAGVKGVEKWSLENANRKPGSPLTPIIPREHGMFFGEKDKVDQALIDWNDSDKRPIVRLIYDANQDPGPLKFNDIFHKLLEDRRVDVQLVPVHTPKELIEALAESKSHLNQDEDKDKGPVVNIVGVHGDLREGKPGADLFVGGFNEENKVDTGQVLVTTEGTMSCFISCFGGLVFESAQNEKNKTSADKKVTGAPADPKPPSAQKS